MLYTYLYYEISVFHGFAELLFIKKKKVLQGFVKGFEGRVGFLLASSLEGAINPYLFQASWIIKYI